MMKMRTKDTNWCPMQCKRDVVLDRWVEATRRQLGGWRDRPWDGQITPKSDLSLRFLTAGPTAGREDGRRQKLCGDAVLSAEGRECLGLVDGMPMVLSGSLWGLPELSHSQEPTLGCRRGSQATGQAWDSFLKVKW